MKLLGTSLSALFLVSTPIAAQPSFRADVNVASRYVWHGISRTAGWFGVLQPSVAGGFYLRRTLQLQGGAVGHFEIDPSKPGELSETGVSRMFGFGELDLWSSLVLGSDPLRLESGVVRYAFQGNSARGGLGKDRNTTEWWVALSAPGLHLSPAFEVWTDIDRVRGVYLSGSTSVPVLAWPFHPFIFLNIDTEAGWNLGQGRNPACPNQIANFAGRGLTHAAAGLSVALRTFHWPGLGLGTFRGGFRTQVNADDSTRSRGLGRPKDLTVYGWLGATLALGGVARRAR